jgi:hypothetical protein
MATSPHTQRGRGRSVIRKSQPTARLPPPHHAASLPHGVDGRLARGSEYLQQHHHLSLPTDLLFSCAAPFWASVVRDGVRPRNTQQATHSTSMAAVSRDDFFALYERCIESRLKAASQSAISPAVKKCCYQPLSRHSSPPSSLPQLVSDTVTAEQPCQAPMYCYRPAYQPPAHPSSLRHCLLHLRHR